MRGGVKIGLRWTQEHQLSWLHGVSLVLESSEVKRWAMGSPESRLQAASLGVPKAKMRLGVGGGA